MPPSPQTSKLTSTLHLLIPRLRLLQKKDTASSVIQRRDLSGLLAEGRDSSARIRVENVIATDIAVEVMEMIELYCELLLARANVLDQAAFGERGAQARNRARVASSAAAAGKQVWHGGGGGGVSGSGSGDTPSGGSGGRFAFFGLGAKPASTTATASETADHTGDAGPAGQEEYLDPALDEAAAVIFYAYPRFPHDVRELTILRNLLAERWGKEFMALAQEDAVPGVRVPSRVAKALRVRAPSAELVDCYLMEIARAYGVNWGGRGHRVEGGAPTTAGLDDVPGHDGGDGAGGYDGEGGHGDGGDGDIPSTPRRSPTENEARRASETLALNQATPPRGLQTQAKSPVSVAPPGPRLDNLHPRVKVPGDSSSTLSSTAVGETARTKSEIPELDELTRRFAALRR
ncbi:hypothetical protein BO82DRAFT_382527 [Aspergillus uvarum CBS 121591]|uniref:DUF292-domain-containing protein n=1 Tax=Aspergillus uvarum CBS 121591 TaxID=1448315 RepID=A0A319CFM1_9EURO|nr:hypothetical protein BO82DRAFT_382527 [Aspergillus uvarum CBS 121591]PYH83170.1 hypothetical protein BO82DRAFT_382527 [Aspergillus uvarum CBS 121591]